MEISLERAALLVDVEADYTEADVEWSEAVGMVVDGELVDTTRWGYVNKYIFFEEGRYYMFFVEFSSGDGEYTSFDDGHPFKLEEVQRVEKVTYEWRKV